MHIVQLGINVYAGYGIQMLWRYERKIEEGKLITNFARDKTGMIFGRLAEATVSTRVAIRPLRGPPLWWNGGL